MAGRKGVSTPLIGWRPRHFTPRTGVLCAAYVPLDHTRPRGDGLVLHSGPGSLVRMAEEWDALAVLDPSPFTTTAWLVPWWEAYGRGELVLAALHAPDGHLRAAVALRRTPLGGLAGPADDHTDDWDAVAEDDAARRELWTAVAGLGSSRLHLPTLRSGPHAVAARES